MEKVNVFDVAKYILGKTGTISTLKLQKLVYYCQAWSLAWDGVPLFDEEFEAWANGPVCPELFAQHKGMFSVNANDFKYASTTSFTQDEKETMDSVLETYSDKESHWLSELTHKERPWKESRGNCQPGDYCSNVISKNLMQEYYAGLI